MTSWPNVNEHRAN